MNTEAGKHANDPVTFSDVEFVSLVRDGKPVIQPFNGDMLRFKLSGTSVIQVNQVDMRRDGDSWVILRRRWVPDPAWMTRSKQGATELADLFMPNFTDKVNQLAVELTCQRFLVTNGKTTLNLTLDCTNPAHGAAFTTLAKLTRKGQKEPVSVEISFDPIHWVATKVQPLSTNPQVAARPIIPDASDRVSFLIETLDAKDDLVLVETEAMTWGKGPSLLFSHDEPGRYGTILSAITMDGRTTETSAVYEVETNPDLASWAGTFATHNPAKLRLDYTWLRHVVAPDGSLIDTKVKTTLKENVGNLPGFFNMESALILDGKPDTLSEFWLFRQDPLPTMRIIQPIAGGPDLCWYGPVCFGEDPDGRPWIAMKVMQMGGAMWKWRLSVLDHLRIDDVAPPKPSGK